MPLFTRIDRYIVLQFLRSFGFALVCFLLIFILVDLFENLDKFIDNKFSLFQTLNYYYYFIPEIIKLVTPIAMLLAVLFTIGRLINFNELTAIKNAGVSLFRFMAPFLLLGIIVSLLSLYFNNWIVPEANKKKFFIERNYLGKNLVTASLSRLYFQDSPQQVITIERFNEPEVTAHTVSILKFNNDTLTRLIKRIDAENMKWDGKQWIIINAVTRDFENGKENIKMIENSPLSQVEGLNKINLVPGQITKKQLKPDELNYDELKEFLNSQKKGGQNAARTEVDFYSKISFPFSNLIVVIFAISISTRSKKRKSLAMQFAISLLITFVYLGFVKFSQVFGYNGDINPVLTAWLANIGFASVGGVNLYLRNY